MPTTFKPMPGDCWFCGECKYGPMLVEVNPACCVCSHKLDSAQKVFHGESERRALYHRAKDYDKTFTGPILPQIIYDYTDDIADSGSECEDDYKVQSKEEYHTHHPNAFPPRKGIWKDHTSIAISRLAGNKRTLLGDSIQHDLLDDSAISDDQNSSDHSDDDTSNSDCSTCTWSSNSTGASSTMDTDISSRAWSLAQRMVDALAGTIDWRAPSVTRPANPRGGSSSKRNNSAVTEGSSDQASREGKRQRTAGNTKKAQPLNDRDPDEEEEEEEDDDGSTSIQKNANAQPRLPCIFFIQSLRRPDLPPICTNCSLKHAHRLKEHIERKHLVHQCVRCGKCFPKKELLHDHIKKVAGCLPNQIPPAFGVNESTLLALKSKKAMRGRTDEEKWKHMYQIIFPDESHVPSPYDLNIPPSDYLAEGAREISVPKEQFWKSLHKALYAKLENAFRELLEDDTPDVPLKEILNECINLARTETMSPRTSDSEPKEDFPVPFQRTDALQDCGSPSNFAGVNFDDTEVSGFDLASAAVIEPSPLESVQGQTAGYTRCDLDDSLSAHPEVAPNMAAGPISDLPTFMPTLHSTPEFDAIPENPSQSSKEESCELQYVLPTSDLTFFTLFDDATYPTTESNYHFANEPLDASQTEQQDAGPSFHPDGVDDVDWSWLPDLLS